MLIPAAALALIPLPAAVAEARLFTTPEQRERLDRRRAEMTAEELAREPEPEPETQAPQKKEPPPRVHLHGFVRRSDGPSAVWVNDGSSIKGIGEGIRIHSGQNRGDSVVVRLPDGRRVRLKPGQTWEPETGQVSDHVSADSPGRVPVQGSDSGPEITSRGDDVYEDFVRALEAYMSTDASATPEAFQRSGQRYAVLESTARVLARRDKTESQREALLNRLERAREAYVGTPTDSPSDSQLAAQRRNAMEAIELALRLR